MSETDTTHTTTTEENAMHYSDATAAYSDKKASALAAIEALRMAIESYSTGEGPINWGHAGSMGEIDRQLAETLGWVKGDPK